MIWTFVRIGFLAPLEQQRQKSNKNIRSVGQSDKRCFTFRASKNAENASIYSPDFLATLARQLSYGLIEWMLPGLIFTEVISDLIGQSQFVTFEPFTIKLK